MERKKQSKIVTIILIIALLIGMAFLLNEFRYLNKEGTKCRTDPFVWGASKVASNKGGHVECSCSVSTPISTIPFSFTENGVNVKQGIATGINLSGFLGG